jgi:molybdopterin converting factor small subunit
MRIHLLFFGVLRDIAEFSEKEFISNAADVGSLNTELQKKFPGLEKHAYRIAVNNTFVTLDKKLEEGDEVAFLPAFAGG